MTISPRASAGLITWMTCSWRDADIIIASVAGCHLLAAPFNSNARIASASIVPPGSRVKHRFTDSTHVYQGYVGGVDDALLDGLDQLSCQGLVPDLTLLLDINSNAGLARTIQRGNAESRFESKGAAFHHKVRQGFVDRAEKYPDRIAKIDAARPADAVTMDVIIAVRALLVAKGMIAAS